MAKRPLPAHQATHLLHRGSSLKALSHHARHLLHLQQLLVQQLPPAAKDHCHVASLENGCLPIITTHSHWATQLRFQQQKLKLLLQPFKEFGTLRKISIKVHPSNWIIPKYQKSRIPKLSFFAMEHILSVAEGIRDSSLRTALEKLAAHGAESEQDPDKKNRPDGR